MRKGIWIAILVLSYAMTTGATDLDAAPAVGNGYNSNPKDFTAEQFKKFIEGGTVCYDYSLIDAPDGYWWTYANLGGKTYAAQIFHFSEPGGFSDGTLRWRVRGESGMNVYLYRWVPGYDYFDEIDHNTGGSSPPTKEVDVYASWFGAEGDLLIMAVVVTSSGYRAIDCDVLDIQY